VGGVFAIAESRGLARVSEGDLLNSLDVHVHHIVAHHAESESRRPVRKDELVDHNRGLPGSEDELMASAGNLGIDRAGFARAPLRRRAPPRPPVHDEKGAGDGCRQCPRTMQTLRLEIPRRTYLIMNRRDRNPCMPKQSRRKTS
jgi:hypothetical protein